MRDCMNGKDRITININEHGSVSLVDVMPRLIGDDKTCDSAILQAARVSYGDGTKTIRDDKSLIRYLMEHEHSSPFEMVEFKFHIVAEKFTVAQLLRHRTANVNEYSARYSKVLDRFLIPDQSNVRSQSKINKQSGDESCDSSLASEFSQTLKDINQVVYNKYLYFIEKGICREQARMMLPQSVYTELYWKIDLRNLLHFLRLRLDPTAQKEIRDYATAIYELVEPLVPQTIEAFREFNMDSKRLSLSEIKALRFKDLSYISSIRQQNAFRDWAKQHLDISL